MTFSEFLSQPRARLWISLGLAVAAFFVFGYWALRLEDRTESVTVVTAARDLVAPSILQADDLQIVSLRRAAAPKTALVNPEKAVGLTLTHPLSANQVLTINELAGKLNPELTGFSIPQDLKGFVLTNAWLAAPLPKVKKDDTLTLIVGAPAKNGRRNTGVLAERVPVLQSTEASDGTTQRVLLALDLATSLQLLQARANNFFLQAVVDGLGANASVTSIR